MRLALLSTVAWIVQLTEPVIEVFGHAFSWKDMILIAGGLFLLWKATKEIHTVDPHGAKEESKLGSTVTIGLPRRSSRSCCWTSSSRSTASSPPWA
jgi:predicted tellurium resistance membrane protein TerC